MSSSFSISYIFTLIDRFSPAAAAMAGAAGRLQAGIAAAGAAMAGLVVRMTALTAGVGLLGAAFAVGGIRRAAEFEEALTSLRRVTNISREEMLAYGKDALKVGVETGKSGVAIANIMTEGALLGVRGQKSLEEFARTVAKVSVTWDDMGDKMAGRSLATLSAQWFSELSPEEGTKRLNEVADAVNELSNRSAFKAPELLKAYERGGVMAKQFGLTPEQFAAYAGAALVVSEKSGELQGTRARMTFQKLAQNISNPTKRASEAMDTLGYTPQTLSAMVKADPQAALLDIMARTDKAAAGDNLKRIAILGDLVDKRSAAQISAISSNINEYKKQLAIVDDAWAKKLSKDKEFMQWLKNGSEGLQQIGQQLERYNQVVTRSGSVNREFQNRTESLNFAMNQLGEAWDRLRINMSMPLLAPLRHATNYLTDFVNVIGDIAEKSPSMGALIGTGMISWIAAAGTAAAAAGAKLLGFNGAYTALMAFAGGAAGVALVITLTFIGLNYWEQIKTALTEPHEFKIKFPDAPPWLKAWMDIVGEENAKTMDAVKNSGAMNPAVANSELNKSSWWRWMFNISETPALPSLPPASGGGMPLPEANPNRIPQAAAERLQIESQIKGQIDPLQVHAEPITVNVTGQVNGPVSGTGTGALTTNAPRGVSTEAAGSTSTAVAP